MSRVPYVRLRFESSADTRGVTRADIVSAVLRETQLGALLSGARLPPVRVLQHQLGLAKNTIQAAYDELVARGVVANRQRQGYFVQPKPNDRKVEKVAVPASPLLLKVAAVPKRDSHKKSPIRLGSAFIDNELLPAERVTECFRAVLRRGLLKDYDAQGYPPLRALLAQRLQKRGIPARADDVIATTGSQQALDVVTRALQKRSIATENPAYGIGKQLFEMNQMDVTGLPLNPFTGIDLHAWRRLLALNRPALLYITTNFHNPTGYSYSTAELLRLLELSRELQFGVVEDDWGADMLSYSEYRPGLRALGGENVLYMNSFTKKVIPSLRLGYLLANEATRNSLLAAKRVATLANPTVIEAVVHEFVERGYYDTHLRRLQIELDARYCACLQSLSALMPEDVRWTTPGGGPVLWLELPGRVDLHALTEKLRAQDVLLDARLNEWFFSEPHLHGTRINYAQESIERTRQGLELLAKALR